MPSRPGSPRPRGAGRAAPRRPPPTRRGAAAPCRRTNPAADSRRASRSGVVQGSGVHSSSSGTSRIRPRSHSPTALPCGSNRVLAATPAPEQPVDHDVDRPQVRQRVHGDRQLGRLGQQLADLLGRERRRQPGRALVRARPQPDVRRPALVPAARAGHRTQRRPPGGSADSRALPAGWAERDSSSGAGHGGRRDVDAGAVGQDGDVRHLGLRHVGRGVDAERRAVAGRRGEVEAGIAGQRHLDRGAAERPADDVRRGVERLAAQQHAGAGLGVGVRPLDAELRPHQLGRPRRQRRLELRPGERRLGLDPVAGEHEGDLVAVTAQRVEADLRGGRRPLAADAGDPHPVGPVVAELDACRTGRPRRGRRTAGRSIS